jgi:multidrug efflux pump subunit AcrA (membrane-fusion protein)
MRLSRPRSRAVTVGVVIAVVGGGAAAAVAATSGNGPQYRTATVRTGSVRQTITLTGTLNPVTSATVNFPAAGTVATVKVHAGQHVAAGQTLGVLQTHSLREQVTAAQATVAAAQSQLAGDEAAQNNTSTGTTSTATTGNTGSGSSSNRTTSATSVTSAQKAVTTGQQIADAALSTARQALTAEIGVCGAGATTSPRATTSPSPAPTATPTTAADASGCIAAAQSVLSAQQRVSQAQQQVANSESRLAQLLATAATSASQPTVTARPTGTSTSSPSTGQRTPTAADLAADQAKIDAAQAQLAVAQQNLQAATLTSPIAGTIASVTVVAGQAVTASPTTGEFTVVSLGAEQATVDVGATQIPQVHVGERATVTPDGTPTPVAGHVSAVNIYGTTSSAGSTSYPVTIALDGSLTNASVGENASVTIITNEVGNVLTVPTSAIQRTGTRSSVDTLHNGTPSTVPVTVGAIGTTTTQIKSGLKAGDVVVLATVSAPVPASNSNSFLVRRLTGGAGGGGLTGGAGGGPGGGAGFAPGAGRSGAG